MRVEGTAGAPRPRPSPKSLRLSGLSFGGDQAWLAARLAEGEPGLRESRRTEGAPRRGACEAPPIRHGTAVTPSPPGKGAGFVALGRGSPTVAPLRVGVVRSLMVEGGGDLLRRPAEVTQAPPAVGRGARTGSGHLPGVRARQPRERGSRGQCPPGASHNRVAAHPLCAVTPASAARLSRAVPSRNPRHNITRAHHDRRRATQSRAGCGHCPPGIQGHCPLGDLHDRVAPRPTKRVEDPEA